MAATIGAAASNDVAVTTGAEPANDVAVTTGGFTGAPGRTWARTGGERTAQGKSPAARMANAAATASGEAALAAAPGIPSSFSPAEYSDSETVTGPASRRGFVCQRRHTSYCRIEYPERGHEEQTPAKPTTYPDKRFS